MLRWNYLLWTNKSIKKCQSWLFNWQQSNGKLCCLKTEPFSYLVSKVFLNCLIQLLRSAASSETDVLAFWTKYDFEPEDWSDKPLLYRNRCFFIWVNLPNAVCGKDKLIIPMIKDPKQSVIAQDQIKLI